VSTQRVVPGVEADLERRGFAAAKQSVIQVVVDPHQVVRSGRGQRERALDLAGGGITEIAVEVECQSLVRLLGDRREGGQQQ
jgi:hypothetical protein